MIQLYHKSSFTCSKKVTEIYSTSFTLGIRALHKQLHDPIYAIYGFVRYADEIVDTFHDYNKSQLLNRFKSDTFCAIEEKISLNPILHAFQLTINKYNIDIQLVKSFLHSMEMDLNYKNYKKDNYEQYIYGSAEVVGLMCLKVFCENDEPKYQSLTKAAKDLGAAFQKVNFLRDLQSDFVERGRTYFPNVNFENFSQESKLEIEAEITKDFEEAYKGIIHLPEGAKFGVYLAYVYYLNLFKKIKSTPASEVMHARIRVSNTRKIVLWAYTYFNSNVLGIYAP